MNGGITSSGRRCRKASMHTAEKIIPFIWIDNEEDWAKQADDPINRKWWDYMADIMDTNPDNSPVSKDLHLVFHLD